MSAGIEDRDKVMSEEEECWRRRTVPQTLGDPLAMGAVWKGK